MATFSQMLFSTLHADDENITENSNVDSQVDETFEVLDQSGNGSYFVSPVLSNINTSRQWN